MDESRKMLRCASCLSAVLAAALVGVACGQGGPASAAAASGPSSAASSTTASAATSPVATPERIAHLIELLGPPASLRENLLAQDELEAIGAPALPQLRAAGAASQPFNAKRIRATVAYIDIKRYMNDLPEPAAVDEKLYPWSQPVAGLAMRLSADRQSCAPGEPIRLKLEIKNVDAQPRPFVPIRTVFNTRVGGSGASWGSFGTVEVRPAGKPDKDAPVTQPYEKRPTEVTLQPGEVRTYRFRTGEKLDGQHTVAIVHDVMNRQTAKLPPLPVQELCTSTLAPGVWEFRVVYAAATQGLLPDAQHDLQTSLTVTVR